MRIRGIELARNRGMYILPCMTQTIPITTKALLARLNRKLHSRGEIMKKAPVGSRWAGTHGPYFIAKLGDGIVSTGLDLVQTALSMKVMQPWEKLSDE